MNERTAELLDKLKKVAKWVKAGGRVQLTGFSLDVPVADTTTELTGADVMMMHDSLVIADNWQWNYIDSLPCDDQTYMILWCDRPLRELDAHCSIELIDHDSTPEWWKERGAIGWMSIPVFPKWAYVDRPTEYESGES